MEYLKRPITYIQQIERLKEHGLLIQNEEQALKQLQIISYFRLANYWRPMEQDKNTHQFKPNSYFENALNLYYFDKKLRALIFTAIQSIEIALRTQMIHHVSMKYGAFWFMDETLCVNKKMFEENLTRIQQEVKRSKEEFIQEHFVKYKTPVLPPVWKTLEVVSLGTLSKLYCNLADNGIKKQIAREFKLPQHLYLESWFKCAAVLRNCVAHHARIWNRRFPLKPQLPHKLSGSWINTSHTEDTKFYVQLCYLAYLQDCIHPDNTFKKDFFELLHSYPNVDTKAMGFPENWQSESLWKLHS
ncbi:MAG: Abi family protein [Bacteroides sp.]|nr:Abi family protein [Bacteroides sp.]